MKQYILFDHDGVLVDTEKFYYKATQICLGEIGILLSQDVYLNYQSRGESLWNIARLNEISNSEILTAKEKRDKMYKEFITTEDIEIPGVSDALQRLSSTFRLCIVTTSKKSDFMAIHRSRDLVKHFVFMLTIEDYNKPKPHPDPYKTALTRFSCKASDALVIEDSSRGLKSALAANIDCIIIKNSFTLRQDFTGAMKCLENLSELAQYLGV